MCLALAQPGSLCIRGMLPSYHIGRLSCQGCAQEPFSSSAGTSEQALGFLIQAALSFGLVLALSDSFQWSSSLSLSHHPMSGIRRWWRTSRCSALLGLVHKARPSVVLPLCSQRAFSSKLF